MAGVGAGGGMSASTLAGLLFVMRRRLRARRALALRRWWR